MATVSVNLITKDQPIPTARAVCSLDSFLKPGDEVVIVDTGSSRDNLKTLFDELPKFPDVDIRVIQKPELSEQLAKYIEAWLPDYAGVIEKDGQYADVRGILDFAGARNIALDASRGDLIFWIDSDDVLVEREPGRLRAVAEKWVGGEGPYSALFLEYDYAFAEDGTLTTTLKRERIARRGDFRWKGACHETLVPTRDDVKPVGFCEDSGAKIVHTDARKKSNVSDIRNYIILRRDLEAQAEGDYVDPRTLLYIANACRGLMRLEEALRFYKRFVDLSGSYEDRYAACMYIASIYMHIDYQRPLDAHDWYERAIEIKPDDPRAYFGISRTFLARYMHREAVRWFQLGRSLPEPTASLHSYDPNSVRYQPYLIAAKAYIELGDADSALQAITDASRARPNDEEAQEICKSLANRVAGIRLTSALNFVANHVPEEARRKAMDELCRALYAVPEEMERAGLGAHESSEDDPRAEAPTLAIMCGDTPEEWGPKSVETGIGGSEKMVILLAPELQKRGWNVTVYANIPYEQRGVTPDGVRWCHWSAFDAKVPVDVFVVWRNHGWLRAPVAARKRVLWCHDVQHPAAYDCDTVALVDHVILQSEYHAAPLRGVVPDEKLCVLHNAIDNIPCLTERNPKKIVFMSSPDRGAVTALKVFKLAKKIDPELQLTILYGFTPFERKMRTRFTHRAIPDLGRDGSLDDYERTFWRLVDETGAKCLHRVGFERVKEELSDAGIWLYPTRFHEISCMGAMEAQAAGLVCVATDYAALAETILPPAKELGSILPPVEDSEQWWLAAAQALVSAAQVAPDDPRRSAQARAANGAYHVESLAEKWAAALK